MAYEDYNNACNRADIPNIQYNAVDIKFLLKFKADDIELIEVNETEYNGKHSNKLFINGRDSGVKLLLDYNNKFRNANESYGVYLHEDDLVKDVLVWYKKKQVLVAKYRHSYERTKSTINKVSSFFEGREEFLI